MHEVLLLLAYCAGLVLFSLLGGALPRRVEMTHTRTQLAMSLVSGLMLGIAFFHLLPHAVITLGVQQGLNAVMLWLMLGLVVMLLLLRILHFHHPDYPAAVPDACHHDHGEGHDHPAGHSVPQAHERGFQDGAGRGPDLPVSESTLAPVLVPPRAGWKGVLAGLTFHSFIDGVALGAAFLSAPHGHNSQLLGFGVFLAILLHKPLDAMSITALMKAGGASARAQFRANVLFAAICPAGALLFYFYALQAGLASDLLVAAALAFSAGAFICIALSDLLPEVQFHSHDRVKLTLVFLLGIGLSYLMAGQSLEHSHAVTLLSSASGG